MSLLVTESIVLHVFDYLDSSRIIRVVTRDAGVLSLLARGARRPKSRFGNALDLFVQGTAHVQVKPGRDLQTLVSFDVTRARSALALGLERFAAASALAELMLRVVVDEAHSELFDLSSDSFDALSVVAAGDVRATGIAACWRMIGELGFAPVLEHCSVCHASLDLDATLPFSHSAGGMVCASCARQNPTSRSLPPEARGAILGMLRGSWRPALSDLESRAHQRLLREFLSQHIADDRQLQAFHSWERGSLSAAGS